MIQALLLALLLAGCASSAPGPLPRTTPSLTCDQRMVDHNRRTCIERGAGFMEPVTPGSCGACTR